MEVTADMSLQLLRGRWPVIRALDRRWMLMGALSAPGLVNPCSHTLPVILISGLGLTHLTVSGVIGHKAAFLELGSLECASCALLTLTGR